jgi:hypothetical protein
MGTSFYGRTRSQRYLDFAFEFEAASTSTTPIYSDYIWMSVHYCFPGINDCAGAWPTYLEHNLWTDGGWS